jgi:hypothetical protein
MISEQPARGLDLWAEAVFGKNPAQLNRQQQPDNRMAGMSRAALCVWRPFAY